MEIHGSYYYRESRLRSLLKALSWRILGTVTTATVAYVIVGEVLSAVLIGGVEFFLKFAIYYAHERAWQLIPDFAGNPVSQLEVVAELSPGE
jgi:uncharacterized membrane protein